MSAVTAERATGREAEPAADRLMRAGQVRSVSRLVAAPPELLYRLVSDVRRVGEWSPECRAAGWLDGATGPVTGARFRGVNRWGVNRWARVCEVTAARPGAEFAFRTVPTRTKNDSTLWRFTFEPADGGTLVTESYEILRALPRWIQTTVVARSMPHHFDMRPHMALTLDRLAALAAAGGGVPQLSLPGQAAAPAGPVDVAGMYVMHAAFRRDLDRFAAAVPATPVGERRVWRALERRWALFAGTLHKHHSAEDAGLWPLLRERAAAAGDPAAVTTLDAMEAEHEQVDPLLAACAAGFAALAAGGDRTGGDRTGGHGADAVRDRLAADVAALRDRLGAHLVHEERDAMALVQAHLTEADWLRLDEEHFMAAYSPRDVLATLPWVFDGLPAHARARVPGGPTVPVLARLLRRGYDRRERAAFRHLPA